MFFGKNKNLLQCYIDLAKISKKGVFSIKTAKKIIGVFLAVLMVLASVPVSVFAAEGSSSHLHGNRTYRHTLQKDLKKEFAAAAARRNRE